MPWPEFVAWQRHAEARALMRRNAAARENYDKQVADHRRKTWGGA